MRWRLINLLLVPVIVLTVACSLANITLDAPQVARQLSAPCPFHPQQESPAPKTPAGESADQVPQVRCLECLTDSVLRESPMDIGRDMTVAAVVPLEVFSQPDSLWVSAVPVESLFRLMAETPPAFAVPLRV